MKQLELELQERKTQTINLNVHNKLNWINYSIQIVLSTAYLFIY